MIMMLTCSMAIPGFSNWLCPRLPSTPLSGRQTPQLTPLWMVHTFFFVHALISLRWSVLFRLLSMIGPFPKPSVMWVCIWFSAWAALHLYWTDTQDFNWRLTGLFTPTHAQDASQSFFFSHTHTWSDLLGGKKKSWHRIHRKYFVISKWRK